MADETTDTGLVDAHYSPRNAGAALVAVAAAIPAVGGAVERREWWTLASLVVGLMGALLSGNLRPRRRREREGA